MAKRTLCQGIKNGGLKCSDMIALYKANRIAWIGKLLKNRTLTFTRVIPARLRICLEDIVRMNYDKRWADLKPIAPFHTDMLIWFKDVVPRKEPCNGKQVRCQIVWNNMAVCIQGIPLSCQLAYKNGIRYVDDFVGRQGSLLNYQQFRDKFRLCALIPLHILDGYEQYPTHGSNCS